MTAPTILWVTTLIMFAGGLLILLSGKRRTRAEEFHTVCHGIVPIIAACAYFAMATGQGAVLLPVDATAAVGTGSMRLFYFARYIDWVVTTPLLLLTLSATAMHAGPKRYGAMTGVVLADVLMIVTAFAFGASEIVWVKWVWFALSCIAFLGVYYVLWIPNMQASALERDDIRSTYRRHAGLLSLVWLIYPLILAVAPDGLGLLSDPASVLAIAVLDVIAKVAYGLMTISSDAKATDRDLLEGTTTRAAPVRQAA